MTPKTTRVWISASDENLSVAMPSTPVILNKIMMINFEIENPIKIPMIKEQK